MAVSTEVNLSRYRGDTSSFTVTITSDGITPIDITGYSFTMTVDPAQSPSDASSNIFDLSTAGGEIVITDGPNGIITITPSTLAAANGPGNWYYDLQMTDAGGLISTILTGTYEVLQDITK